MTGIQTKSRCVMPWVGPSLWGTPSSRAAKGPGSGVYSWLKLRLIQRDSIPDFTIPQRISLVLTPDASPEDEVKPSEDQTDEQSLSDMALGLLHIPTSCHYGVDTLRELPHTRRKESLFVAPVCSEYLLARKRLVPGRRHTSLRETRSCSATPAASPKPPSGGKRRQSVGMCPSVRSISPYNQCSNSPLGSAHRLSLSSQRSFSSGSDVCSCDSCPRARYFRRRSSSLEDIRQRLGSDESRRRSLTLGIVNHHAVSQHGTPSLGEVKFALSYDEAAKTLRFVLIRAEGVGSGRETRESYIYAKLTLLPGNCQKQKSRVVKCTHSPVYIQEFVFTDIDRASLDETTLTVRFLNKTHRFRADQFLGEIRLCLQDEDLQQELRAWRPLQPKQNEGLGDMQVSLCQVPQSQRLRVSVRQGRGLSRQCSKAPSTYVRLQLCQQDGKLQTRETELHKKTQNPVYEEEFSFHFSPKSNDFYSATLTLNVICPRALGGESVIGQVRFGAGATESQSFEHWNNVMQNPDSVVCAWHPLVEP